jgi:hypothetical protein
LNVLLLIQQHDQILNHQHVNLINILIHLYHLKLKHILNLFFRDKTKKRILLASSPQINNNFPLSLTCLTNSLFERISSAGAAKPDKCSATIKYKPILIDHVRTSKNCGQSPFSPCVKNNTGNNVCLRRSIEAQSGSNVDKTITRLPAITKKTQKRKLLKI